MTDTIEPVRPAHGEPTPALLEATATNGGPTHESLVSALERGSRDGNGSIRFDGRGGGETRPFSSILDGAARWSRMFRAQGIDRGDRVPLLMTTGPAFVESFFGALLAGAIPVPLAAPMTFGSVDKYLTNLERIVRDAEAHVLVTTPRIRDAAKNHAGLGAMLRQVFTDGDVAAEPFAPMMPSLDATDTAFIQYTSGTTGHPKGVVVSHRAAVSNAFAIANGLAIGPDDVGVSWLPMFHDMGLIGVLLTAVCHPYAIHLMSPEAFIMRPERWLSLAADTKATLTVAPNFAYDLCVARAQLDAAVRLDSLRLSLNGSEPVQPNTTRRFAKHYEGHGFDANAILPVYGMAENTLAVTFAAPGRGVRTLGIERTEIEQGVKVTLRPGDDSLHIVSCGRPVHGTRVSIHVPDGSLAHERVIGEVWLEGCSRMDGYFRQDKVNEETFRDGWVRTGDLGFTHDGELYLVGRAKDMIIKGGKNIYPYDLERIASGVHGVRSGGVAAFGRPNGDSGTDDIVVIAETMERDETERARIVKEVRGECLAVLGVKVDDVLLWPAGSIPRTTSGKVQRGACARLCAEGPNRA